jgi:hypothetical protein
MMAMHSMGLSFSQLGYFGREVVKSYSMVKCIMLRALAAFSPSPIPFPNCRENS